MKQYIVVTNYTEAGRAGVLDVAVLEAIRSDELEAATAMVFERHIAGSVWDFLIVYLVDPTWTTASFALAIHPEHVFDTAYDAFRYAKELLETEIAYRQRTLALFHTESENLSKPLTLAERLLGG